MEPARHRLLAALSIVALLAMTLIGPAITLAKGSGSSGEVRTVTKGLNAFPATGDFTPSTQTGVATDEFAGESDEDADSGDDDSDANIVDRSMSHGHGNGASVNSSGKAKSNPTFIKGFEGLNHYQQRYSRGGNQFSVEPPDQGMCAGNGFVVEAVNDVFNVFNTSGASQLPDNTATNIVAGLPRNVNHAIDLNSFLGYAPAIDRAPGHGNARGPFVTDPSCLYDAQTQRWFLSVLTLESTPGGAFTGKNHIDLAVSQTSNPTGLWNLYQMPVQDDGTDGTPDHHCALNNDGTGHGPCLGDYPHIGADSNGFYVTTNEYAFFPNFVYIGAQVYAFSKAALAAGASTVSVTQFNTAHDGVGGKPGFTVWPAQSASNGGGNKEYFLSSDAGDEAQCDSGTVCTGGTGMSSDILLWTMSNTNSLNSPSPSVALSNTVLDVLPYAIPPKQQQPGSGTAPGISVPQGHCLNDTTTVLFNSFVGCWALLVGAGPTGEVVSRPDSNDSRMQQVMFANGKLWGALDTALNPGGGIRAGIAWYIINPNAAKVDKAGYLGATGLDFTYPAIGVTQSGRGVMAFTATGGALNPSAAYASIDDKIGVGSWNVVPGGEGAAPDDGFTSYKAQVGDPPRTRWGDYGAAAVDGNNVWLASEYIAHACNYTTWGGPFFLGGSGDNLLGTCAGSAGAIGTRTALANWSTFISQFKP